MDQRDHHVIKPIPTEFNGIKYRSRLEARWAVFFRLLNVDFRYEYEGYSLNSGWYLPDFWLPSLSLFVEIKPTIPSAEEQGKCRDLSCVANVTIRVGDPLADVLCHSDTWDSISGWGQVMWFKDGGEDHPYKWCLCPICNRIGIEFDGRGARVCNNFCRGNDIGDKNYTHDDPIIISHARQASMYIFNSGK
jgi:hypothetical protein